MNVIVICLDTLRWDALGCYGSDWVETPCIDAFARRATRFDSAYCASFPTIPMRTDAFTGNVNWPRYGWKPLGSDEVTITQCLKEAGYHTAFIHDTSNMVPTGFGRDFDEETWIQPPDGWQANKDTIEPPVPLENMRQNGVGFLRDRAAMCHYEKETDWAVVRTMRTAAEWLEQDLARDKFFLWVDTFEIHEDWYAPPYYTEYYDPQYVGQDYSYPNYGSTEIYEDKELQRLRRRYAAEVTLTDRWVGFLLRQIELTRPEDDTMVIIVSDHGMYLGEHERTGKHTADPEDPWPILDEVGRIPLLIHLPGKARVGKTPALVQPADIAATILDVCGVEGPEMVGRSLMPVLTGKTRYHHDYVFTSCHSGEGEGRIPYLTSQITVTSPKWQYVTGPKSTEVMMEPRRKGRKSGRGDHRANMAVMAEALREFMRERGAAEEYIEEYVREWTYGTLASLLSP